MFVIWRSTRGVVVLIAGCAVAATAIPPPTKAATRAAAPRTIRRRGRRSCGRFIAPSSGSRLAGLASWQSTPRRTSDPGLQPIRNRRLQSRSDMDRRHVQVGRAAVVASAMALLGAVLPNGAAADPISDQKALVA